KTAAAETPEAKFFLGGAYLHGLGVAVDLHEADRLLSEASKANERMGQSFKLLRRTARALRIFPFLRYQGPALTVVGLALLAWHAWATPFSFSITGLWHYFLALGAGVSVGTLLALFKQLRPMGNDPILDQLAGMLASKRVLPTVVRIVAEDGLFIVP